MKKDDRQNQINLSSNFLITIHHQENYSWQGVIHWLDTGKKVHFRSELELMNLIHGAVQLQAQSEDKLRTWNKERQINAI